MEREGGWKIENLVAEMAGGYVKIEYKEGEVLWIANDQQNTSGWSVRSSNTFNENVNKHSITSVKWGQ